MLISDIDQEVSDFDWFAVDPNGCLFHVASGGGHLPASVATSREKLDILSSYFSSLPILYSEAEIFLSSATAAAPFPELFTHYACRGLVSFSGLLTAYPMGTLHELIARPPSALLIKDVSPEMASLIAQTRLPFSVVNVAILDTETVA